MICLALGISMMACSDDGDSGDGDSGDGGSDSSQGGAGDTGSGPDYYTVSVEDYKGEPVAGVIVRLLDASGNSFKAQPVGVSGEKIAGRADFTDVKSGSYAVALLSTTPGKALKYSEVTVSEENKHVTVLVYDLLSEKEYPIYGSAVPENSFAYTANGSGGYSLDTVAGITYVIFFADEKGIYELSVDNGKIGFFGNPMNVFDEAILSDDDMFFVLSDKKIKIEIPDVNTPYVIGIESEAAGSAVIKASRVSALPKRPTYDEFVNVTAKATLSQYTLDTTLYNLVDVDIKSRSFSVELGEDGYYYTSDGKLVVIRINTASSYIDSLAVMAGLIDENIGGNISGYIYDGEGNYLRKELYNDMIASYSAVADEATGVYPLTEEMANAIKNVGALRGWWSDGGANIFDEQTKPFVNKDIAWLLMCAYLEEK